MLVHKLVLTAVSRIESTRPRFRGHPVAYGDG
jgi:hypothetical protein